MKSRFPILPLTIFLISLAIAGYLYFKSFDLGLEPGEASGYRGLGGIIAGVGGLAGYILKKWQKK